MNYNDKYLDRLAILKTEKLQTKHCFIISKSETSLRLNMPEVKLNMGI